jgi:hypothetical protein
MLADHDLYAIYFGYKASLIVKCIDQEGIIMNSIGLVAIQSAKFPNVFLRMDGAGVNKHTGGGSGVVNCQYYPNMHANSPVAIIGNYEVFDLIPLGSRSGAYAIRSLNFPNSFLRMDGSNAHQSKNGSGLVNCQYYSSADYPTDSSTDYEHYLISESVLATRSNPPYYSIVSGNLDVYLRIDGSKVTSYNKSCSGTVNCQVYPSGSPPSRADDYEVFNIIYLKPPSEVSV